MNIALPFRSIHKSALLSKSLVSFKYNFHLPLLLNSPTIHLCQWNINNVRNTSHTSSHYVQKWVYWEKNCRNTCTCVNYFETLCKKNYCRSPMSVSKTSNSTLIKKLLLLPLSLLEELLKELFQFSHFSFCFLTQRLSFTLSSSSALLLYFLYDEWEFLFYLF